MILCALFAEHENMYVQYMYYIQRDVDTFSYIYIYIQRERD